MVEDEDVQRSVLRTGKVDTIISEPIGVMLLHERMARGSEYNVMCQADITVCD